MSKLSGVCGTISFIYGPANNVQGSLLHSPLIAIIKKNVRLQMHFTKICLDKPTVLAVIKHKLSVLLTMNPMNNEPGKLLTDLPKSFSR